jgi:hypothetical protein
VGELNTDVDLLAVNEVEVEEKSTLRLLLLGGKKDDSGVGFLGHSPPAAISATPRRRKRKCPDQGSVPPDNTPPAKRRRIVVGDREVTKPHKPTARPKKVRIRVGRRKTAVGLTPRRHDHGLYAKTQRTPQRVKMLRVKFAKLSQANKRKKSLLSLQKRKVVRRERKIEKLTDVLAELKAQNFPKVPLEYVGKECKTGISELLEIKKAGHRPTEYSQQVRQLAFTLHFYSPRTYRLLRMKFHLPLPAESSLRRWLKNVKMNPGFLTLPLLRLKQVASTAGPRTKAGVIFDEMSLSTAIQLQKDGTNFGTEDLGIGVDLPSRKEKEAAGQALVFMAVGLNKRFRVPYYWGLTNRLDGPTKAALIKANLVTLQEEGNVDVAFVTCDGLSDNKRAFELLGMQLKRLFQGHHDKQTCSFPNPSWKGDPALAPLVYGFQDAAHNLKLLRNHWAKYGVFYWGGEVVKWDYVRLLHEYQKKEKIRLGNKLSDVCINF